MNLKVEQVARVLNHFNIGFSEGNVLSYLERGFLEYAPPPESGYHTRNTKYGYTVSRESLVKMLVDKGISQSDVDATLPN